MEIKLYDNMWIINDECYITEGVNGYEVYTCGTDTEESKEVYANESFECCLMWVWNSL